MAASSRLPPMPAMAFRPADAGNGISTADLGSCGGVLQPPPSGDQGMTQPPPDQGKTPVIKPGEVPVQPPKQ